MPDLVKLLHDLQEKVNKVGAAPTDGEKDNLQKMVQDAVDLQMKAFKDSQKTSRVRKGQFVFENEEESKMYSSIEKRIYLPAKTDLDREIQKWNDDILLVSTITKSDPRSLKIYEEWHQTAANTELRKALGTSLTGGGTEWIPTQFSAEVVDRIRVELKVARLFSEIVMPTNPYKIPVVSADATGYLQSESLANDATKLRASTPVTTNMQLSTKKLAARVVFSEEVTEDSIIPILPWLKSNVVIAIATAEEKAVLNGDITATHQDSNVTAAYDAQKAWYGLRWYTQSGAKVDCSTFSAENIRSIRAKMTRYGVDPKKLAMVVSMNGYIKLLSLKDVNNNPMVSTLDKYGPQATILTGELAKMDGQPIIVSEWLYDNLDATGVYSGTGNAKTIILVVYFAAFVMGDRRKVTIKTDENIETDQQLLVATERKDFQPYFNYATEYMVGQGYNIS